MDKPEIKNLKTGKSDSPIVDAERKSFPNYLYDYKDYPAHVLSFVNALGEKNIYDSLWQCNRCGYCETVCPTYMLKCKESLSPRGRNQLIKMVLEGKLKNKEEIRESLFTCLLCGACASACYAKVQTKEHVLEARRSVKNYSDSLILKISLNLLLKNQGLFAIILKILLIFKKIGLSALMARLGIFKIVGMPQFAELDSAIFNPPLKFLSQYLKNDASLKPERGKTVKWVYFAPCGPNYIYPDVGIATVSVLKKTLGEGVYANNSCCGLTAYNYGKVQDAKKFAGKNIADYEKLKERFGDFSIIGDCSSCVAFMKTYPRLFSEDKEWKARAEEFSKNVKDILEVVPEDKIGANKSEESARKELFPLTYHDSCAAFHGQGIRKKPRKILKKIAGENFKELNESDWCCGGAGAYFFTQKWLSEEILLRKIKNISFTHAKTVIAGSTSCLIQLEKGLKKHYPSAKAVHFSSFLDKFLK